MRTRMQFNIWRCRLDSNNNSEDKQSQTCPNGKVWHCQVVEIHRESTNESPKLEKIVGFFNKEKVISENCTSVSQRLTQGREELLREFMRGRW
jgi:hypothetical protein